MTYCLTFAVAVISAVLPLVNVEAYLLMVVAKSVSYQVWALALAAAAGQTLGKLVLFLCARGALRSRRLQNWYERRVAKASGKRGAARMQRWSERLNRLSSKRAGAFAVVFVSASVGLPPLLLISILAAGTALSAAAFTAACLSGRWLRFALLVLAPGALAVGS